MTQLPNDPMARPDQAARPDIENRLQFLGLDRPAQARLRGMARQLDVQMGPALADFYRKVAATPELRRHFPDEGKVQSAKSRQQQHWREIAKGEFGETYTSAVRRIGSVHADIGLEPRWYIGGYGLVLDRLLVAIIGGRRTFGARMRKDLAEDVSALVRAALLDIDLSISIYLQKLDDARRQIEDRQRDNAATIAHALAQLAEGNFGARIGEDLSRETRFNETVERLGEIMSGVVRATQAISTGSAEIAAASDDLARRTEQQAASLEETSASLDQLTATMKDAAVRANTAQEMANEAGKTAQKGSETIEETRVAMQQVSDSAREMEQIIGVIKDIAFQTNLLALNAGVEAARAGDSGRGFAVVAAEVRALAQRSAEAVSTIQNLIERSNQQTQRGSHLVGETHGVLGETVTKFNAINALVVEMAAALQHQSLSISEINTAVRYLDQMTQQNAAMVEETNATTVSLSGEAGDLMKLVRRFSGSSDTGGIARSTGGYDEAPARMRHTG